MNWDTVLEYLPDGLCILLCLFDCLCNWVRTGSMKKMLQEFCPSSQPLKALTEQVKALEKQVKVLSAFHDDVVGELEEQQSRLNSVVSVVLGGDEESGD